jgi:predicted transglutaminase-like cysteine proteinase
MEQHEEDESRAGLLPNLHLSVNEVAEDAEDADEYDGENSWRRPKKCPPDCHEMNLECENLFNHIEGECGCKGPHVNCEWP